MNEGKKTALFGGSFDPVHNGHVQAAIQIGKKLNVDKIVFLPNYKNPLKMNEAQTSAEMRIEMLKLAAAEIPGAEISEIETEKKSVSCTAETLRNLKKNSEKDRLWFVMGEELFSEINRWKNFSSIFENANVAVISRAGAEKHCGEKHADRRRPPFEIKEDFTYHSARGAQNFFRHKSGSELLFVKINAPNISSTEIRDRIKNGLAFEHLVPAPVADFIKRNKLYARQFRK